MAEPVPWAVRGELVLAWARRPPAGHLTLPGALRPLPGRAAVAGVRYDASPVGPFLELSVAVPARLGAWPGLCVVASASDDAGAVTRYRDGWGVPAELGRLTWRASPDGPCLRWEERDVELRARPWGPPIPVAVPVPSVQRRGGEDVVVPRSLRALMRLARVEVRAPPDDELWWVAGSHPGAALAGARMVVRTARRPAAPASPARRPSPEAEPGLP